MVIWITIVLVLDISLSRWVDWLLGDAVPAHSCPVNNRGQIYGTHKQILWMYSVMDEVGYPQPWPAILWNDNASTVLLLKNMKHNVRVKYIDIQYHCIHDCISDGAINVHHIPSTKYLADMLMKQHLWVMHKRHCLLLHLCDPKVPVSARGSDVNKG